MRFRALKSEGVCQSVLYGLPLIVRPTSCCHLDWDEMEMNHHHFHALCHALRVSPSPRALQEDAPVYALQGSACPACALQSGSTPVARSSLLGCPCPVCGPGRVATGFCWHGMSRLLAPVLTWLRFHTTSSSRPPPSHCCSSL